MRSPSFRSCGRRTDLWAAEAITAAAAYSEVPDDSLSIYITFLASDIFFEKEGRYPGSAEDDASGEKDVEALTAIAAQVLRSLDGGEVSEELVDVVQEVYVPSRSSCGADGWCSCRSGASDLPQIAALMGGLVAQEAIKLVTKQYVPLNGTCIFNGIRSTTSVVKG